MRIFLLGATGGTGVAFAKAALAAGHEVGALVRSTGRLEVRARLTEFVGDVLEPQSLALALDSFKPEALVSTLGTRGRETGSLSGAMQPLIDLLHPRGIERLFYVSSMGVGDSVGHYGFLIGKVLLPLFLGKALREKEPHERAIMGSRLEWTIVRPCTLVDEPPHGSWRVIENPRQRVGNAKLCRTDLAAFLVDELENRRYVRRAVSITGPVSSTARAR
ncbi:MAG: NAD(P)H-binding protein [Myxococcota bacterium]|jgi:putative NADH-flavin reductase|nr:NAD(P)H-binding protein [Myxococcota bacterium]